MEQAPSLNGGILAVAVLGVAAAPKPASAGPARRNQEARDRSSSGPRPPIIPFEFIEDGKIVGYDKDILDAIIKSWGFKMEQLDLPFAGILPGLLQKKFDFVATALLINPERAKRYAFTMPIAQVKVGLLKRKGDVQGQERR